MNAKSTKLAWVVRANSTLARAVHLVKGLPVILQLPRDEAIHVIEKWVAWARRRRVPSFVKLPPTAVEHRVEILASNEHGLSNGRIGLR